MKTIVVAYDKNRAIGRRGELPWQGQLPADMRHFSDVTKNQSVIMGRLTYESLPRRYRPLPERQNIVLSMSARVIDGVLIARTLDEAYEMADHTPIVIGGGRVYEQALPTVDRIFATEIDAVSPGADTFFPELNPDEWRRSNIAMFDADENNKYNYAFVTYLRRHVHDNQTDVQ